jgi:MFS family permease
LGCLVGAGLLIFLSNILGRRGSIVYGLVLEIIGRVVQTSSFSPGQYIAGRFIAGLGNGFISSAVPAWHVECLKTHRRGSMLMVSFGVCVTAGIACSFWVTYGFGWVEPNSASWRAPLALPIAFLLPALGLITCLPESPRYLILNGKEREALNVLSALNELPHDHEDNRREYLMIKNAILYMLQGSNMPSIFSMGKSRYAHRVILAVGLQIMQQFTGVNLFVQYLAAMFWNQLGFAPHLAGLLAGCCATTFCIASILSLVGMDRFWGRRGLTIFGCAGMLVSLIVLAVMAEIGTNTTHLVMAVFLFVYCTFFSVGWQGMSWLWAVELVPLSVRGPANALASATNWLANWMVVFFNPLMLTNITWRTYIVFGTW